MTVPRLALLLLVAAAAACHGEKPTQARSGAAKLVGSRAMVAKLDEELRVARGAWGPTPKGGEVDGWEPAESFAWSNLKGTLPAGWGREKGHTHRGGVWLAPAADRARGVVLRVDDDFLGYGDAAAKKLLASPGKLATSVLEPIAFVQPPGLVADHVEVRVFHGVPALVVEGAIGPLRWIGIFADVEADAGARPKFEALRMAYPASLAERYDVERDAILASLTIAKVPVPGDPKKVRANAAASSAAPGSRVYDRHSWCNPADPLCP